MKVGTRHLFSYLWTVPTKSTYALLCRTIAESFYNVKYGLSIITSKVSQKNLSNEIINTGVSVVFKTKRELWQYGLYSFQTGGTKLERFLPNAYSIC